MAKISFVLFLTGACIMGSTCGMIPPGKYNMGVLKKEASDTAPTGETKKFVGYFYANIDGDNVTVTEDSEKQVKSKLNMSVESLQDNLQNSEYEIYVLIETEFKKWKDVLMDGSPDSNLTCQVNPILPSNITNDKFVRDSGISFEHLQLQGGTFRMGYVEHEVAGNSSLVNGTYKAFTMNTDKLVDFYFGTFSSDNTVKIKVDTNVTVLSNQQSKKRKTLYPGRRQKIFSDKDFLYDIYQAINKKSSIYVLLEVNLSKISKQGDGTQIDFTHDVIPVS